LFDTNYVKEKVYMIIFLNRVDKKSVFGGFYLKKNVIIKKNMVIFEVCFRNNKGLYLFVEGIFVYFFLPIR
jgi:hypothetical protein